MSIPCLQSIIPWFHHPSFDRGRCSWTLQSLSKLLWWFIENYSHHPVAHTALTSTSISSLCNGWDKQSGLCFLTGLISLWPLVPVLSSPMSWHTLLRREKQILNPFSGLLYLHCHHYMGNGVTVPINCLFPSLSTPDVKSQSSHLTCQLVVKQMLNFRH